MDPVVLWVLRDFTIKLFFFTVADKEIKVDLNIGYELTKPFQHQKNKLYEISS